MFFGAEPPLHPTNDNRPQITRDATPFCVDSPGFERAVTGTATSSAAGCLAGAVGSGALRGFAFSALRAEPDLWGHVQYGRDALADGLPATTTYSFTAEGYRWINHENLSEMLFAWSVDHLGRLALLAGKCLLGVALWRQAVARSSAARTPGLGGGLVLVAANLTGFWQRDRRSSATYCSPPAVAAFGQLWELAGKVDLPWGRQFARMRGGGTCV